VVALRAPTQEIDDAKVVVRQFSIDWYGETPMRLHSTEIAPDGSPQLHGDFIGYLEDGLNDKKRGDVRSKRVELDSPRRRVSKAFRLLRRKAPKEFDVLYCMVAIDQVGRTLKDSDYDGLEREFGASVRRTRARMSLRAAKRGDPQVSEDEILVLVVSGVRKLGLWAG
jgi:hypothetical protein